MSLTRPRGAAGRSRARGLRRGRGQVRHARQRGHHRGGGRRAIAPARGEARGRSRHGRQVRRHSPRVGGGARADDASPPPRPRGHPQSSRGRGARGDAGGESRGDGRGSPAHPRPRPALRAGQGRPPQGRCGGSALHRPRPPGLPGRAHRARQYPRHRLHTVRGHDGEPRPGPPTRRGRARRQGLCHAGHPRGLRPRARSGPATALPDGVVMADEQVSDPEADRALGKMSFMEHLGELRTRIMWSLVSVGVALVVALFLTDPLMRFIALPITRLKTQLMVMTVTEGIWTYMKVALVLSIFISMPAILWQVWKFVAPGLHEHEKKYALPFVLTGSFMFLLGGAFAL